MSAAKWKLQLFSGRTCVRELPILNSDDLCEVYMNIGVLIGHLLSGSLADIQNKCITIRFKDDEYKGF